MKKFIRWTLTVLLLLGTTSMTAQTFKLSGGLREMLEDKSISSRRLVNNSSCISLIMKVTDASQMAQVCDDYKMKMVADLGHIAVVTVPVDQIKKAAADPRVVRMEKEGGFHLCLDEANKTANLIPVAEGHSPLSHAYTGKGILVGVIDNGFQYNHPTFQDANGQLRIHRAWDLEEKDGESSPVVLSTPDEILARKYSFGSTEGVAPTNHGTHVAGIAAGSGRYRGMAPESDLIVSEIGVPMAIEGLEQVYSDALVACINDQQTYATEQQQPLVINISLGQNLGFSSETKLLQEAFGLLTGPGRILVAAIGNEGNTAEAKSYFNSGKNLEASVVFESEKMPISSDIFWKSAGSLSFSFEVMADDATKTFAISSSQLTQEVTVIEQDKYTVKCLRLDDAPDGKQIYKVSFVPQEQVAFYVVASVTGTQPFEAFSKLMNIVSASPTDCIISNDYTACIPAVFPNVIGVGNYCNRELPKGVKDEIGVMNNSSSWGPTWDGRNKPDVAAPGSIISSGNCYSPENIEEMIYTYPIEGSDATETWAGQSGSSQASPVVAGIVALWLQAKPELTPDDVLDAIRKTSHPIEPIPNNHSGAGIIDAYAGLLEVLGLSTAIKDISKHQPENVTFRIVGNLLYVDGVADGTPISIYTTAGVHASKTIVKDGCVSLSGLSQGIYAVQIGKLGSTLIRL